MKREEIEELREYLRIGAADTAMPVSFLAPRVLRLLAEREALVGVLERIVALSASDFACECRSMARAALALTSPPEGNRSPQGTKPAGHNRVLGDGG